MSFQMEEETLLKQEHNAASYDADMDGYGHTEEQGLHSFAPLDFAQRTKTQARRQGLSTRRLGAQFMKEDRYTDGVHEEKGGKRMSIPSLALLYLTLAVFVICGIVSMAMLSFGTLVVRQEPDWVPHWGEKGNPGEGLAHYPTDITRDIVPIPCHSHNDYWRRIPLYEAVHYGLTSVEADVWLMPDGELLVGHDRAALSRNRTFRSLYIDPIRELLDHQNPNNNFSHDTKNGVFDTDREQTLILLVDIKTDGYKTLPAVQKQLEALRSGQYLTYFDGSSVVKGAIQVVMTGNTPFDLLTSNTTYRDTFFDAPLDKIWEDSDVRLRAIEAGTVSHQDGLRQQSKLKSTDYASGQGLSGLSGSITGASFTPENSYYASVSFRAVLGWGPFVGKLTEHHLEIIKGQIKAAQAQGLKVRYWETPLWPISLRNKMWTVLVDEGVDYLNVDDLKAAATVDWQKGGKCHVW